MNRRTRNECLFFHNGNINDTSDSSSGCDELDEEYFALQGPPIPQEELITNSVIPYEYYHPAITKEKTKRESLVLTYDTDDSYDAGSSGCDELDDEDCLKFNERAVIEEELFGNAGKFANFGYLGALNNDDGTLVYQWKFEKRPTATNTCFRFLSGLLVTFFPMFGHDRSFGRH